jgi:uncharacterized protein (DUF2141 family)
MKRTSAAIAVLFLVACAQVRELQGGEKDVVPPLLLAAEPPNGTTHFDNDRITLRFNERVKLDRVRDRLLISPPLDKAPEVTVNSGEDVVITLRAPLTPNTTYTFNLGEAITDITEGNPAAGLTYVMSTGDVLDSAEAHGSVINAFTDEPEADVLVILHSDTDTAGFTTGRPGYFTRTDKQGRFRLNNLRGGRYHLHALQDQNANFRKDLPNERLAFNDTLIDTKDSLAHVLRMFLPLAATQQLKEAAVQPDRAWRFVLARPADSLALTSIDRTGGTLTWTPEWNLSRDTVLFWPSDTTLLASQHFTVSDSSGIIDTLIYRPVRKMPFYLDVKPTGRWMPGPATLQTSRPIARINPDRAFLRIDSMDIATGFVLMEGEPHRWLSMEKTIPTDRPATLLLLPGAFRDIYGGENDTLRLSLGSATATQTGDLKVNVAPDSLDTIAGPFFLQLLNAQGGVVRTDAFVALPHKADFGGTPAGVYTLKLIADADGDGRWSTGSLTGRRQPERVFRQQGEVNVRAGWEVVVDWSVKGQ